MPPPRARERPLRRLLARQCLRPDGPLERNARKVFDEMVGNRDLAACNALLDALCLCEDFEAAVTFFEQMPTRDAVSWTIFVSGLSRSGRRQCALNVFRGFLLDNMGRRFEEATLVSMLSACANL